MWLGGTRPGCCSGLAGSLVHGILGDVPLERLAELAVGQRGSRGVEDCAEVALHYTILGYVVRCGGGAAGAL